MSTSRRPDFTDDVARLPEDLVRVAYDADREVFHYQDKENGEMWEGEPGNRYGELRRVVTGDLERPMFAPDISSPTQNDDQKGRPRVDSAGGDEKDLDPEVVSFLQGRKPETEKVASPTQSQPVSTKAIDGLEMNEKQAIKQEEQSERGSIKSDTHSELMAMLLEKSES